MPGKPMPAVVRTVLRAPSHPTRWAAGSSYGPSGPSARTTRVYNHTAVVRGIQGGTVKIAQHGYAPLSTLPDILARNKGKIVAVAALRPRSR
ncbi:hypothetical protein [Streptomyces globosus]|uniref:hypothetical protein n=1 Tax=Streptomyces globosus TaxID=68209 RepID=UPI0038090AA6